MIGILTDFSLASVSGILCVLIFPKFGYFYLAYFALVPLLISIRRSRSYAASAFLGFLFGLILFGATLYWITVLSKWAGPWAFAAWAILSIFQALFAAAAAASIRFAIKKLPSFSIVTVPLIWALFEWLRSLGPYGVTGSDLSYSQVDLLPVLQLAALFSSYGISFLLVFVNEAIAETFSERKVRFALAALCVFIAVCAFGIVRIDGFHPAGEPLKVSLIQANVPQDVKMDYGMAYEIVNTHELVTAKALESKPDLVVWPETAVTTYLFETRTILGQVKSMIRASGADFLIGTPYRERDRIYNSLAAFDCHGDFVGVYNKQRLVPFGEYLPLRRFLSPLFGENELFAEDYNSDLSPKLLTLGRARIAPAICFESTLPYLVRQRVRMGANLIVVVTNDAWFFKTAALWQHLAASRMRAVENGLYVIQAANTGISAVIDPIGRVVKESDPDTIAVINGTVYLH